MKISELLNESIFDRLKAGVQRFFTSISRMIPKIGFGQKVEFKLGDYLNAPQSLNEAPKNADREVFDLTSMIGYINEYAVAWKLAYGLEHNGVNVKTNVQDGLRAHYDNYKSYMLDNILKFKEGEAKVLSEIQRAEDGSEIMAKKMWDEIVDTKDLKLIDVTINITGKEAAGQGKEDIVVIIKKKDTEEIEDMIKASMKLYKTPSGVNVYNSTFASYLISVVTDKADAGTGKKAIKEFLTAYPEFKDEVAEVLAITDEWTKIKTSLKKQNDPGYREKANEFITQNRGYQKMRDLLFKRIFAYFYATDKEKINERVLHRLGLDGADDVYLLVGTERQKMTAVSSRTSDEFKRLYENLRKDFTLRYDIPADPEIVACYLVIVSEEGEDIAKFTISFKEGATFPHMWNMKDIVDDEKRKNKEKSKT
jgi:hypothetical protein